MVVRGAGGWGGERGPSGDGNAPPDRAPDAVVEQKISADQALLYRLSGDWNPLHADPAFAQAFGFPRPILHGLCTYGFAARHVIKAFAGNDARLFKSIRARFAESVFPGETLVTEMWKECAARVVFRTRIKERDKVAISNAAVELYAEIPAAKAAPRRSPLPRPPRPRRRLRRTLTSADIFVAIRDYIEKTAGPRRQGGHGLPVPPQGARRVLDRRRQERQGIRHRRHRRRRRAPWSSPTPTSSP